MCDTLVAFVKVVVLLFFKVVNTPIIYTRKASLSLIALINSGKRNLQVDPNTYKIQKNATSLDKNIICKFSG